MNFFSKTKNPITAVISVSEEGVIGFIVKKNKRETVLHQTRKKTGTQQSLLTISDLIKSTNDVVLELIDKGEDILNKKNKFIKKQLKDFVIIIDSPFQYSYLTDIISANEEPVEITDDFIENLLKKTKPESKKEAELIEKNKDSLEFIKKKIVTVNLNGYPVEDINNKQARFIDISVLASIAPKKVLFAIRSQIEKEIKRPSIEFFSKLDTDLAFINSFDQNSNYEYIKIDMSESYIITVTKGIPQNIINIPFGYQEVINQISEKLKISTSIANSYASIYFSGKAEKNFSKNIENIVLPILNAWELEYEKTMEYNINKVYLNCENILEEHIKKTLNKKHPNIEILTLKQIYDTKTGLMTDKKTEIITNTYFVNRIMEN